MIYGINNMDIKGIEKVLDIYPEFEWDDIKYIEKMEYYIDVNEYAEKISNLVILFLIELPNNAFQSINIKFNEINCLNINHMGGKYNQIIGFEVVDQKASGWEADQRYVVRDYENGLLEFFCKSIEIL